MTLLENGKEESKFFMSIGMEQAKMLKTASHIFRKSRLSECPFQPCISTAQVRADLHHKHLPTKSLSSHCYSSSSKKSHTLLEIHDDHCQV